MSGGIIVCPGCETKLRLKNAARDQISCPRCGEEIVVADMEVLQSPPPPPPQTQPRAERPWHNVGGALGSRSGRSGNRSHGRQRGSRPAARANRQQGPAPMPSPRPTAPLPLDHVEEYDPFDDRSSAGPARPAQSPQFGESAEHEVHGGKAKMVLWAGLGIGGFLMISLALGFVAMQLIGGETDAGAQSVADRDASVTGDSAVAGDSVVAAGNGEVPSGVVASESAISSSPAVAAAPSNSLPDRQLPETVDPEPRDNGAAANADQRPQPADPVVRPRGDRLVYNWKPGDEFVYSVEIKAETDSSTEIVSGTCTYRVGEKGGPIVDDQEGSGSGFAVSANGYIATCAHVVENATGIEVTLGNRSWPATVVAADFQNDLALLKIEADGLVPLSLADSDSLQLAQTVRVIGYPLSDVLGRSIKVTTGTISGIGGSDDRGERIQVDASINPGNSGGPLFNEFGQVIGVASSKLAGRVVSDVGFAVPVNELRRLLRQHSVEPSEENPGPKLTGPQVVQKVSPSVAYLSVKGGGSDAWQLTFSAQLSQSSRPKQNRFSMISPPSHTMDNGRLKVNQFGEVLEFEGEEHLPFVLGPIGSFFIEKLDPHGQKTWRIEDESTLQRIRRNDRFGGMFGPRFRPPRVPRGFGAGGFDPFAQDRDEVLDTIPAIETTIYRLGEERNNRVTLEKEYSFTTTRDRDDPAMTIRGKGEVVFDRTLGMPQRLDYSATIEDSDEDGKSTMPLTVSYVLRDMEVVKAEREAAQKRMEEMKAQQEREKTEPNPELIASLLEEIRQAEGGHGAWTPMRRLSEVAVVEENRDDVLRVARNHLHNSNSPVRDSAVKALFHWSSVDDIDELLVILNDEGTAWPLRKELIKKIAELKDPKALPSILESINQNTTRSDAAQALVLYGAAAEESVLEALDSASDDWARRELLDVLRKIGTQKSIARLEEMARGNNFAEKTHAQRALDAIRARL